MVGHEYTTSTAATPITVAMTMKTKSSVIPRKTRSVGFLPNRVVTQSRLRPMIPRSSDTVTCCISPPFQNICYCPGRADSYSSRTVAGLPPSLKHERSLSVLQEDSSLGTRIAGSTPTFHGFDLDLALGNNVLWQWYVAEGHRILLTIMYDPPEHIRNGHPLVGIRLGLVHKRPGETGDGIGGIARRVHKVEAQVGREGSDTLGCRCRALDRW